MCCMMHANKVDHGMIFINNYMTKIFTLSSPRMIKRLNHSDSKIGFTPSEKIGSH